MLYRWPSEPPFILTPLLASPQPKQAHTSISVFVSIRSHNKTKRESTALFAKKAAHGSL
jgi:hypothetical protein